MRWSQSFSNSDMEVPRTMSEGSGFKQGEGVAGLAWANRDMVIIPNVPADLKKPSPIFAVKTKEQLSSINNQWSPSP